MRAILVDSVTIAPGPRSPAAVRAECAHPAAGGATLDRATLIADARQQWTRTEAAVGKAARGRFNDAPAEGGWSAADIYRHVLDTARKLPEGIHDLVRHGQLRSLHPGDEDGIKAFRHLDDSSLPAELRTVHGTLWLALQQLSEKDLAREVTIFGSQRSLGSLVHTLVVEHEQQHVAQALKAAGVA